MNASRPAHIPTHPPPIRAEAVAVNGGGYQVFTPAEPVRAEPPATAPSFSPFSTPPFPDEKTGNENGERRGGSGSVQDDWFQYPCPLPEPDLIHWEKRTDKRAWVAHYAPDGKAAPRRTKTPLGFVGVRQMKNWMAMPEAERGKAVADWLAAKAKEKGVSL